MKKIINIKNKVTKRHICFIICLLIPIGLLFVPGTYEINVSSSTNVIKENSIKNYHNE